MPPAFVALFALGPQLPRAVAGGSRPRGARACALAATASPPLAMRPARTARALAASPASRASAREDRGEASSGTGSASKWRVRRPPCLALPPPDDPEDRVDPGVELWELRELLDDAGTERTDKSSSTVW